MRNRAPGALPRSHPGPCQTEAGASARITNGSPRAVPRKARGRTCPPVWERLLERPSIGDIGCYIARLRLPPLPVEPPGDRLRPVPRNILNEGAGVRSGQPPSRPVTAKVLDVTSAAKRASPCMCSSDAVPTLPFLPRMESAGPEWDERCDGRYGEDVSLTFPRLRPPRTDRCSSRSCRRSGLSFRGSSARSWRRGRGWP